MSLGFDVAHSAGKEGNGGRSSQDGGGERGGRRWGEMCVGDGCWGGKEGRDP